MNLGHSEKFIKQLQKDMLFQKGKAFMLSIPRAQVIDYLAPLMLVGVTGMEDQTILIGAYLHLTKEEPSPGGFKAHVKEMTKEWR